MPKYIIEREMPGVGDLSPAQLQAASEKSCSVITAIGPRIQWVESFVTADKLYCIYIAPDEETVRKHARMGDFPANQISLVHAVIDPTTAEPFTAD